jgi:hypothetical protein
MREWLGRGLGIAGLLALSGCGGKFVIDGANALITPLSEDLTGAYGLCDEVAINDMKVSTVLLVASQPVTCGPPVIPVLLDPMGYGTAPDAGDGEFWEACFALPTDLAPGTFDLSDLSGPPGEAATYETTYEGSVVGGLFTMGSLSITTVGPSSVSFAVSGMYEGAANQQVVANGTYEALRCP